MGVWIETHRCPQTSCRGYVTPYVGVWIETELQCRTVFGFRVTPYVGVWIETVTFMYLNK